MQKEEKLKRIEEVIKVVCPELMELSFGCKIKDFDIIRIVTHFRIDPVKENFWLDFVDSETGFSRRVTKLEIEMRNGFEILGHPIRLSHVLRAIAKTNKAVTVNVFGHMQVASPSVSSDGLTIEWEGCDYDLTKDDLSLQSPETIDFLFNILCE